MAKVSKAQRVEQYMREHGSITSWEAITMFHATRLSDIIFKMRKRGLVIENKWERSKNSDGVEIPYVRYCLVNDG